MISDSIIDVPVNDSDYEYCKQDKLREEAESAMRDDLAKECEKCGEYLSYKLANGEFYEYCKNCNHG